MQCFCQSFWWGFNSVCKKTNYSCWISTYILIGCELLWKQLFEKKTKSSGLEKPAFYFHCCSIVLHGAFFFIAKYFLPYIVFHFFKSRYVYINIYLFIHAFIYLFIHLNLYIYICLKWLQVYICKYFFSFIYIVMYIHVTVEKLPKLQTYSIFSFLK